MEKEVLITIGGVIVSGEDKDNVDVIIPGEYYYRRGRHYLTYEDVVEEGGELVRNLVWITPEEIAMHKKGSVSTEMVFRTDQDTTTQYSTPMGAVSFLIHTKRIRIFESEHELEVKIDYTLEWDYQTVSEHFLSFHVQSRKKGKFSLNKEKEG